jgi:hypothetical protein
MPEDLPVLVGDACMRPAEKRTGKIGRAAPIDNYNLVGEPVEPAEPEKKKKIGFKE